MRRLSYLNLRHVFREHQGRSQMEAIGHVHGKHSNLTLFVSNRVIFYKSILLFFGMRNITYKKVCAIVPKYLEKEEEEESFY